MRKNKKILREGMKNIQQYSINKGGEKKFQDGDER